MRDVSGKLISRGTPNQDNPLSDGTKVLMGMEVREHSYSRKYQNRLPDYLNAVVDAVNWDVVAKAYTA